MALLAEPPAPSDPVAHLGFVVGAPVALGDPFTVQVPDFDELHVFEIRRWQARGNTIPVEGDEVLVIVDDGPEPWVPAWWPAEGDTAMPSIPVTNEEIESIEAPKITGQIVETQIGPEAISTPKLAAGAVVAEKIQAGTITATEIAATTITGGKIAAGTIEGSHIKAGTIEAISIKAGSITTELLAAEAVTAAKIKAGTIEAAQIKANTITAANIAAGAITATEIKAGSITANEIAALTITAAQIAAGTITSGQIASGTIVGGNIASGTVTASHITISSLSALSANLGTITAGTVTGATLRTAAEGNRVVIDSKGLHAYKGVSTGVLDFDIETGNLKLTGTIEEGSTIPAAAVTGQLTNAQLKEIEAAKITGTITETQIANDSITSPKIKAGAIETAELAVGAVVAEKIAAGTITTTQIAANTIEAADIKAATITTTEIAANTIVAGDIAAGTITATEIAASTITGAKIAATTIAASNIVSETITAAQIKAGTITATELAANSVEASQIKAGAVTATKLNVSELSAIAANLGTVTAGTVNFPTNSGSGESPHTVTWTEGGKEKGRLETYHSGSTQRLLLRASQDGGSASHYAKLELESLSTGANVIAQARNVGGESNQVFIIKENGESNFLQLAATAKRVVNRGTVSVEWGAEETVSSEATVTHELSATPQSITFGVRGVAGTGFFSIRTTERTATTFKIQLRLSEGTKLAKGQKREVDWIAMT